MPDPLNVYIDTLDSLMLGIGESFKSLYDSMGLLHDCLDAEGNPASADKIDSMRTYVQSLQWAFDDTGGNVRAYLVFILNWINDNWPTDGPPGEVTMTAILAAMWASLDWQTLLFVTRIDAMRGSISEKTVTEKSMADQLRHFL
ncbi:unnamed protein product [marine sediment metagenome]|uniref:Uncharacterized protein n=1 Tax=marine sediment metagenome TaxID=412755 RepID=X1RVI0_9ZZZZ